MKKFSAVIRKILRRCFDMKFRCDTLEERLEIAVRLIKKSQQKRLEQHHQKMVQIDLEHHGAMGKEIQ